MKFTIWLMIMSRHFVVPKTRSTVVCILRVCLWAIDGAETNPSFQHLFAAKSSWSYPLMNSFSVLSSIMLTSMTYFKHKNPSKWGKSLHKVVFNFRQCRYLGTVFTFFSSSSSSLNDVMLTHMRNAINDNGCWFPLSFKFSTF